MPDTVKSITVLLPQATVTVGGTMAVSADIVTNVGDSAVDPQTIQWTSSNLAVATITSSVTGALVKGIAAGTATIRAAIGAVSGGATVTVTPPPVPVIDITAAQETALKQWPVGAMGQLRGPTTVFGVQVSG